MLANNTPIGRLERIHCVVASRTLERNESNPSSHILSLTIATTNLPAQSQAADRPSTTSTGIPHAEPQIRPFGFAEPSGSPNAEAMTSVDAFYGHVEATSMMSDAYARTRAQPIPATDASDACSTFRAAAPERPFRSLFATWRVPRTGRWCR